MQMSLAHHLESAVTQLEILDRNEQQEEFNQWIQKFAAQIVILSMQVSWSNRVEESLEKKKGVNLGIIEEGIKLTLEMLAERVLTDLKKDIRQKYEQLITDLVHQREVTRQLMNEKVTSVSEFVWLYHMRFYWRPREKDAL
jgi:dynein heavy chain 1